MENQKKNIMNDPIDDLLREAQEMSEKRNHRRNNPYILHLIKILWPHHNGLSRRCVIEQMLLLREQKKLPIPYKFDDTVQSAFNQYNEESSVFKKSGKEFRDALFYPVGGKGSGRWAVRHDRAKKWLESQAIDGLNF